MTESFFSSRYHRSTHLFVLAVPCLLVLGCSLLISSSTSATSESDKAVTGSFVGKVEDITGATSHDYYLSFTVNQGKALVAVATLTSIYSNKVVLQSHTLKSDVGIKKPALQNKQEWAVDVKVEHEQVTGRFIVHEQGKDRSYNVKATKATGSAGLYWTKTRSGRSTYVGGWILLPNTYEQGGGILEDGQQAESRPALRPAQIHTQRANLDEDTILLIKKVEPSMIDSIDFPSPSR
ncbi:hypothetical protein [Dictyobacter formicarum]|uniref:DUF4412 domain-containing protein n=1 Tax=Dictyobacter formicarum TaxID=2778368 RepID=A0ABQ3VDB3_9CHLR|nr:hypothetical protein [Dictyobacter formicarum]GHO83388.1 hypothetical protein KSZ_13940 [Dictyobacter formicarum]